MAGEKTISDSTLSMPSMVEAACSICALIIGPTGQAGEVSVKEILTLSSAGVSTP